MPIANITIKSQPFKIAYTWIDDLKYVDYIDVNHVLCKLYFDITYNEIKLVMPQHYYPVSTLNRVILYADLKLIRSNTTIESEILYLDTMLLLIIEKLSNTMQQTSFEKQFDNNNALTTAILSKVIKASQLILQETYIYIVIFDTTTERSFEIKIISDFSIEKASDCKYISQYRDYALFTSHFILDCEGIKSDFDSSNWRLDMLSDQYCRVTHIPLTRIKYDINTNVYNYMTFIDMLKSVEFQIKYAILA